MSASPLNILCSCVCVGPVTQPCPTHCESMDCCPSGSSVCGVFQEEPWRGLPFSPPGDLPKPELKPASLESLCWQVNSSTSTAWKMPLWSYSILKCFFFPFILLSIYTLNIICRITTFHELNHKILELYLTVKKQLILGLFWWSSG